MQPIFSTVRLTILCACLGISPSLFSQSQYPYALTKITFDASTKRSDVIPFDKPFMVEIENLSTLDLEAIYLYEMLYDKKNGGRCFATNTPAVIIPAKEISIKEKKASFIVPALKPQKHFEFVIIRKETDPYMKTIELNKAIFSDPNNIVNIKAAFKKVKTLYDLSSFCNLPASSVKPGTADDYLTLYTSGLNQLMPKIADLDALCKCYMPADSSIAQLGLVLPTCCTKIDSLGLFSFCDSIKAPARCSVFSGITAFSDKLWIKVDTFDLPKRIVNIQNSIFTINGLKIKIADALLAAQETDKTVLCQLENLLACLEANKKYLGELYKSANQLLGDQFYYNNNLVSTTITNDLQTESKNRFLLDLGFANLLAKDNREHRTYIPKIAYGVNILFRPVDKSVPLYSLPGTPFQKDKSGLLTKKSIFHYLSLYVGFTVGEMTEPEFTDFYNKTSLMIGPSLRIYRAIRVSAGVAMLRRINPNPILSTKPISSGIFATISVDMDLLKAVNSIIGSFTPSLK